MVSHSLESSQLAQCCSTNEEFNTLVEQANETSPKMSGSLLEEMEIKSTCWNFAVIVTAVAKLATTQML